MIETSCLAAAGCGVTAPGGDRECAPSPPAATTGPSCLGFDVRHWHRRDRL
jgi:hypothetical protein